MKQWMALLAAGGIACCGGSLEARQMKGTGTGDGGVEWGIPADAVFFLAEVAVGPEPQANRRWAVREDGAVLFSANGEPFDFQALPRQPFNRPWDPDPIAVLAREDLAVLMALLENEKVFGLPPVVQGAGVRPPKDGMARYVVARHRGREARVRVRAGAPAGDRIADRFLRLVEARMPWEPGR